MANIEIGINQRGLLFLTQYQGTTNRVDQSLKEENVFSYISHLATLPIRKVRVDMSNREIQNILVQYDKHLVTIKNCERLGAKEGYLRPLLDKVDQKLEQQKLEEVKRARQSQTKSSGVVRTNKHSKGKIVAGVLAFSILAGSFIAASGDKKSEAKGQDLGLEPKVEDQGDINIDIPALENVSFEKIEDTKVAIPLVYENNSNTPKARNAKIVYGSIIEEYSHMYGLDPNIVLAIATQESGVHVPEMNEGGATGLMQIQNEIWVDKPIQAYNFETGQLDSFVVEEDMLKDVYKNVQIGCMYFQSCMNSMNHNTLAALQCYNMGPGNMNKILTSYASDTGTTKEAVLNNPNDLGWLSYRNIIPKGDKKYIENVLSWMEDSSSVFANQPNSEYHSMNVNGAVNKGKVH